MKTCLCLPLAGEKKTQYLVCKLKLTSRSCFLSKRVLSAMSMSGESGGVQSSSVNGLTFNLFERILWDKINRSWHMIIKRTIMNSVTMSNTHFLNRWYKIPRTTIMTTTEPAPTAIKVSALDPSLVLGDSFLSSPEMELSVVFSIQIRTTCTSQDCSISLIAVFKISNKISDGTIPEEKCTIRKVQMSIFS